MTSRFLFCLSTLASGLFGACVAVHAQAPAAPAASPAVPAAPTTPAAPSAFKSDRERIGYAIGANVGRGMKEQGVDADPAALAAAVADVLTGAPMKMSDAEMQTTLTALQESLQKKQTEKAKALADVNKKAGESFLAANKAKEGVKTTASGLQYKVVKEGTGPTPKATDTVSVHYSGRFVDGKEFDSSVKGNEGKPVSFPLNRVIPGWTEGIQLMKVGSKYQFFVPSNLAYGDTGRGPVIEPGATLLFDVELVGIEGKK